MRPSAKRASPAVSAILNAHAEPERPAGTDDDRRIAVLRPPPSSIVRADLRRRTR